jgi:hypothetical protein
MLKRDHPIRHEIKMQSILKGIIDEHLLLQRPTFSPSVAFSRSVSSTDRKYACVSFTVRSLERGKNGGLGLSRFVTAFMNNWLGSLVDHVLYDVRQAESVENEE